ncbi:unnamed protein product [Pleuronectes platessa]|uniref:Uncharacterized protein n=1 Tax=Pleuronectes platessa TaxID=8262 RepID=A0A9N7VMN2_PLEPL|nr:unnamed protein product [Pleuronectes platessa]
MMVTGGKYYMMSNVMEHIQATLEFPQPLCKLCWSGARPPKKSRAEPKPQLQRLPAARTAGHQLPEPRRARLHTGAPSHRSSSYLKLAGEFTWTPRPDGGLAFRWSLSAMPPPFQASIGPAVQFAASPVQTPDRSAAAAAAAAMLPLPSRAVGKVTTQLNWG